MIYFNEIFALVLMSTIAVLYAQYLNGQNKVFLNFFNYNRF